MELYVCTMHVQLYVCTTQMELYAGSFLGGHSPPLEDFVPPMIKHT